MTKRPSNTKNEMVHCSHCGEDYSSTYKRCPFCDEYATSRRTPPEEEYEDCEDCPQDYEDAPGSPRGGKRLARNTRGGGYGRPKSPWRLVGTVLSLAIIVAAIYIIVSFVRPLIGKGDVGSIPGTTPPPATDHVTTPPVGTLPPTPAPTSAPTAPPPPASQTAASFQLSSGDMTLKTAGERATLRPIFAPAGTTGTITWSSSKPDVATVTESGGVVAVAPGNTTITATMAGGYTQSCIVRCSWSSTAAPAPEVSSAPAAGAVKLNREDFTLSKAGERFQLKVSGTSSNPVWSISGGGAATLSGDGVATAVAPGVCTVTAKVDGQTLTCIVRCTW